MSLQTLIEKIKELREASFEEAEEYYSTLQMSVDERADRVLMRANHTFKADLEANDLMRLIGAAEVLFHAVEFALIYDPDVDHYKIKHTAYPKLKAVKDMANILCEDPK